MLTKKQKEKEKKSGKVNIDIKTGKTRYDKGSDPEDDSSSEHEDQ